MASDSDHPTNAASLREEALFALALGTPAPDREALLDRECRGDALLRGRIAALLAAHEGPDTILPSMTAPGWVASELAPSAEGEVASPGQVLGRYTLVEKLGEGGCGVVYVAEQTEPVRRQVAVKILKLGMDTRMVLARFQAERQALALMDHPGIAKVLDAGTTDSGRPYFAMELVRGMRITAYCDRRGLGIRERVELFIKVCQAIQHAHQKGVIHRDIKPSNILVVEQDGVAVPKVIDFGIAKATEGRLSEATFQTQLHQFLGTPAYMSPEQAEMGALDIDTRSDVYSLGVLLYELLTGTTPFDTRELVASGLDAMRRTIREQEPVRPSTRLAQRKLARPESRIPRRPPDLASDLDWIVMKCLEKDRVRRYETANGLAADLKRHLHHEPVVARPPSAVYRFQKAWRRNRIAFVAGAAVVFALALGTGGTAVGWRRAMRERDAAVLARAAEAVHRQEALAHAARAESAAEEARTASHRAEDELAKARLAQARALLSGIQPHRRGEALAALADAARIRPSFDLRTEAIAALALTDLGEREVETSRFWNGDIPPVFDASLEHALALLQPPGPTTNQPSTCGVVRLRDEAIVQEFPFRRGDQPKRWHLGDRADWAILLCWDRTLARWAIPSTAPTWRHTLDIRLDPWGNANLMVPAGGAEVLVVLADGLATLDGATGHLVRMDPVSPRATHFALNRDGSRAAFHLEGGIEVWDRKDWRPLRRWPLDGQPHSIEFGEDGDSLCVGVERGEANVFHVESGFAHRFAAHALPVSAVAFSPAGGFLFTHSWDGLTRWWDATTLRLLGETSGMGNPRFATNGLRVGSLNGPSGASVWRYERSPVFRRLIAPRRENDGRSCLTFSPDGRWLASGGHRGFDLWEVSRDRLRHRQEGALVDSLQFVGAAPYLLASGRDGVRRWRLHQDRDDLTLSQEDPLALETDLGHPPARAHFSAASELVAVAAGERSVLVPWDGARTPVPLEGSHPNTVNVAISPDGRHVVAATWKGNGVSLFDGRTGRFVRSLSPESATPAFRPDSRHLVLTTPGGYRVLTTTDWQTVYAGERAAASGGSGPVAYSPDGRLLAIAVDSRVIHLLDAETGQTLALLRAPDPQNLFGLAFSPDGRALAAAVQAQAVIHLWDLPALRRELGTLRLDWADPDQATTNLPNHTLKR